MSPTAPRTQANRSLPNSHPRNRRGATPQARRPAVPGWLWLVAGVGVGILVTSLLNLAAHHSSAKVGTTHLAAARALPIPAASKPSSAATTSAATNPATTAPAPAADTGKADSKPAKTVTKFDFYTLLPEQEVIDPDQATDTPAKPAGKSPGRTAPTSKATAATGEQFLLQAGSFRSAAEAGRRGQQIQRLGLPNHQESVSAGGDIWYRVLVGPFTSRGAVNAARDKLTRQDIDTIVIRKKTSG